MNVAKAQKFNQFILNDYFEKSEKILLIFDNIKI